MAKKFRVENKKSRDFKARSADASKSSMTKEAKAADAADKKKTTEAKALSNGASKAGVEKKEKKRTGKVLPDQLSLEANGPKLKDFEHHFRTIKGLKEKSATAASLLRGAKKSAKQAGIDPQVVEDAISFERQDPMAVQDYFKQLRATFQIAGVHVQLDMFNEGSISRRAQIWDEGYKAGQEAKKNEDDNPHDANTKAGQTWLAGYREGQGDLTSGAFQGKDSLGDVNSEATH